MQEFSQHSDLGSELEEVGALLSKQMEPFPSLFGLASEVLRVDSFHRELREAEIDIATLFTAREISYCADRVSSYAGRLVAKRAIIKMLHASDDWQDIEILPDQHGCPQVNFHGEAFEEVKKRNISMLALSISHDEGLAAVFVVGTSDKRLNLKVGIDVTSIKRISDFFQRKQLRFLEKYFTEAEVRETSEDVEELAAKWAGKEAVAKALGTGVWREGVAWTDIEILESTPGIPSVLLSGAAAVAAEKRNLSEWRINILSDSKTPIAMVIGYGQLDSD